MYIEKRYHMKVQDLLIELPHIVLEQVVSFEFLRYPIRARPHRESDIYRHYAHGDVVNMLECADDISAPIQRMLRHASLPSTISVKKSDMTSNYLYCLIRENDHDEVLAFCSCCISAENLEKRYIPMMDFRCPISSKSQMIVSSAMRFLGQDRGAVLATGASYFYIGFDLMTLQEQRDFAARRLLFSPFVDERYIGHGLLEGKFTMRLSKTENKPFVPEVVEVLGM